MAEYGRPCRFPGCRAIVPFGHAPGYCPPHRGPADRARGTAAERGYDRAWAALARAVRQEEPWCRFCLEAGRHVPAEHVDHIRPRREGGTDDRANLRALCGPCHRRRTAVEQSQWRPRR